MTVKFKVDGGVVKHGPFQFLPGGIYSFEGEGVEAYMIAAGWADSTQEAPQHTFGADEVSIDPEGTRHQESGLQMADIMKHGTAEDAKAAGVKPRTSAPTQALEVQDVVSYAPAPSVGE